MRAEIHAVRDVLPRPEAQSCPMPAEIRACLWRDQSDLKLGDADPRLWLHLHDGRVLVLRLSGVNKGDNHILAPLLQVLGSDVKGEIVQFTLLLPTCPQQASSREIQVQVLYAAPILPLSKHKDTPLASFVRRDLLAFIRGLDMDALDVLASLTSNAFYASVRNYNRLAALPEPLRQYRRQALQRFPALLAPILLTAHQEANLWGGKRHAWRLPAPEVETAIDQASNLIHALAQHYDISKGLVRSRMNAEFWDMDARLRPVVLQFLDALPAHQRPASAEELMQQWPRLQAYLRLFGENAQGVPYAPISSAIHRGAFRLGWQATWQYCDQHAPNFHHALRDARDFLATAGVYAQEQLKTQHPMRQTQLGEGWLMRHGLPGLFKSSARWHRLRPPADTDFVQRELPALLGTWQDDEGLAHELCSYSALVAEGETMHHCVADYWSECVKGERLFSLQLTCCERATAEYVPRAHPQDGLDVHYQLEQLRGAFNAEVSALMHVFAKRIQAQLNVDIRKAQRMEALRVQQNWTTQSTTQRQCWLDSRSQTELLAVMQWKNAAREGERLWLRAYIAGLAYHAAAHWQALPAKGEELTLQREPDNPHDPLAVRILWQGQMLGYIPRPNNAGIAHAMDAGTRPHAKIQCSDAGAPLWQRVEFAVFG